MKRIPLPGRQRALAFIGTGFLTVATAVSEQAQASTPSSATILDQGRHYNKLQWVATRTNAAGQLVVKTNNRRIAL